MISYIQRCDQCLSSPHVWLEARRFYDIYIYLPFCNMSEQLSVCVLCISAALIYTIDVRAAQTCQYKNLLHLYEHL